MKKRLFSLGKETIKAIAFTKTELIQEEEEEVL